SVPIARWPKLPNFVYAEPDMLAVPAAGNFDLTEGGISLKLDPADRARRRASVPLPKAAPWPRPEAEQLVAMAASLPVPAETVFDRPEQARAWIQPSPLQLHHFAEGEIPASARVKTATAEPRGRRGRGGHGVRRVAHAAHAAPAARHHTTKPSGGGKRSVHVASLKKRRT